MKPIDLESIRAREKKATKGPWKWHDDPGVRWDDPMDCGYDSRAPDRGAPYYCTGPETKTSEQASADALFIAHARTDIPALLELVEMQTRALLRIESPEDAVLGCLGCQDEEDCIDIHSDDCPVDAALTAAGLDTAEARRDRFDVEEVKEASE